ncbi:unnamed protein product [Blumeria hordei]|uniref:N-alpha-acetyltransferase 40 n=2 Tax=Blumeria hordei TaxID=2867405 RepID=A0A383UM74_BLUHO|nr:GNAT family acetyltransferase [Blumeria hordei DH14]SZF01434.1 unnamed protein product [Blumeria hordei]
MSTFHFMTVITIIIVMIQKIMAGGDILSTPTPLREANAKTISEFERDYLPLDSDWKNWVHPQTGLTYQMSLHSSASLSPQDFDSCFNLIEESSAENYQKSLVGWRPDSKRMEMQLLDLKYILVKHNDQTEGFISFMPTMEGGKFVLYCYEIHLSVPLQRTGLGSRLMQLLDTIAASIPTTEKVMLTCFVRNTHAMGFYDKLGFKIDSLLTPPTKQLRNGTIIKSDYVIFGKDVQR